MKLKSVSTMESANNIQQSPLQSSAHIVRELSNNCSCLTVQANKTQTPLHEAVKDNNLEKVCALLYNETDVNTLCYRNFSPFTYALQLNRLDIAQVLFPYHNDFSIRNVYGYTVLHLAAWRKSPIAIDLVKAGVNVNCITDYGDSPLVFSLEYNNADLFKLIWCRTNYQTLLCSEKPFLLTYVQSCRFPLPEWLECINLILDSSAASELMGHCRNYLHEIVNENGFFWELFQSFYKIKAQCTDEIIIIHKCLSLGAAFNIFDVNLAIDVFGLAQEYDILIYHIDFLLEHFVGDYYFIIPFPICMCGIGNLNSEILTDILKRQIFEYCDSFGHTYLQTVIVNTLGYFSLSLHQKQEIVNSCQLYLDDFNAIQEKLAVISEVPSLLELCRNMIRDVLNQNGKVKKPYQFYDAVKMLNLPEVVKDIVRFKVPIY